MHTGGDNSSWHDDTVVEVVHAFLVQVMSEAGREEIDLPHIVICRDSETGAVTYSGPFPNGLQALAAAERERTLDEATNDGVPLDFRVAALLDGPASTESCRSDCGGRG